MSEKDKLDIFMESQLIVNQSNARTMQALGATVADLEKHSVEMKQIVEIVNDVRLDTKTNTDAIADLKLNSSFVKDAKWVFRAVILALIVGACSAVWQQLQPTPERALTKSDIELIIKALK